MAKVKVKKELKDVELINEEQKNEDGSVDYGTQWPSTIGRANKPNDDGKIRDVWGNVLG